MKTFPFIIIILILFSCQKVELKTPFVDFIIIYTLLRVNETVDLKNLSDSINVKYEWDFSDGYTSDEKTPAHTFSSPGNYKIQLIVIDKNGVSDSCSDSDSNIA